MRVALDNGDYADHKFVGNSPPTFLCVALCINDIQNILMSGENKSLD